MTLSHTHTGAACSAAVCGRSLKDANCRDGDPEEKSVLRIGVYGWRAECVRVGVKTRGVLRREPSERMPSLSIARQ